MLGQPRVKKARRYPLNPDAVRWQAKRPNYAHKQIALLTALGWPIKEIAASMQMTPHAISLVRQSPKVIEIVEEYRGKIEEKAIAIAMTNRLHAEFDPSMDKLAKLRDDGDKEETQLSAAKFLVEKAVDAIIPKKAVVESSHKVGVVVFSGDDIARLTSVLDEDDASLKLLDDARVVSEDAAE